MTKNYKAKEETIPIIASSAENPPSPAVEEDGDPEDQKDAIEEACMETKECAPVKAKLNACSERISANPETHEDCLEEFFDLMHCVHQCAPEKIFHNLK